MPSGPRILLVRFSSLGDVILATPLVRALRRAYPGADLTFVTKRAYADVFRGNPYLDRTISLEPRESLRHLVRRLPTHAFDYHLDLHGSARSLALRALLPGRWSGYAKQRASRWRLLLFGGHDAPASRPVAERYFMAAAGLRVDPDGQPADLFPSAEDTANANAFLSGPFVALAPGARHASKRWPPGHWRALADQLLRRGMTVVGVGTHQERSLLSGGGVVDGYGKSILFTAALFRQAQVVVTNDSGLMHVAAAAGRPVVALFGPTVRAFGFVPYRSPSIVLERPLPCRPCSSSGNAFCPLLHHRCLTGIDPASVAESVLAAA
jgi:ADP-heptose:LPS heptosyltransferase